MTDQSETKRSSMAKRMAIMLVIVGVLFGGIFGYQAFTARMIKKFMSSAPVPPVAVSAVKAAYQTWQLRLNAVGSLRALRGIDVTSEISGLVQTLHFKSGDEVRTGQLLVQLNADADRAQLQALEAAAELAQTVFERDQKQFAVKAVSQATLDTDAADLKTRRAQVAQQKAIVDKKSIRAPFSGQLGISTVNTGQYINPGDKIVTLQSLDAIYADFYLPQQNLSLITLGQAVSITTDTYPGRTFNGKVTAINPKVDSNTRNFLVEAVIDNSGHKLLPGMYATVEVRSGKAQQYLTLPKAAVTYNPYGETVYLIEEKGKTKDSKPALFAKQTFINMGPSRGDQVAIIKGVKAGDQVVTSGQLKLKSGSPVIINNQVQPLNDAAPAPVDQ